ncbi:MAG: energy transducer TonB [Cellvibrionaceae bacterium]|nr:energy transducer TonB [Cellvibrionaceae bacterium]
MEPTGLWLVFDTGIKIFLGAGLTCVGVLLGFLWQSRSANRKPNASLRRLQIMEEISSDVGRVNHCFAKYSALIIESTRFGKRWPPARREELEKINSQLVTDFEKLAAVEAKLLMLGEKAMEKTLRLYGARIALFRKQVYVGREDISEQEIIELKSSIMQLREQFYGILSRRYDRLMETQ